MGQALQQCDLFGAPVEKAERRRRASRRKQVARAIEQMRADRILPIDVMGVLLREAIARGEREWIFKIAAELLPYTAPKLAAVVAAGSGFGLPGGGRLQIEWGTEHDGDHAALLPALVPASDPPGA